MNVTGGATDVTTYVVMTLLTDGTDATGLTITDLDLQYVRSGVAPVAKVDATALAATDTAHTDNKAIEIDTTDQPGLYRVDWPDAAFAAGVKEVILSVKHTTCKTAHLRVTIDAPVNVTTWLGGTIPAVNTTGVPKTDVVLWLGIAPLALSSQQVQAIVPNTQKVDVETIKTRAVSAAGAVVVGGFVGQDTAAIGVNATGHVSRVVLVDTLTTYTGNTVQTGDSFGRIGATGSGLTSLALSATALSTATWTAARAGYLDNINNATIAGAVFPTDPADQSLIIAATNSLAASIAALNNLSAAQVNAEVVDVVNVDTLVAGKTIAAALKHTAAGVSGVVSGAGTGTEVFKDFAGSTSFTVTVDASGNRSVVVWA